MKFYPQITPILGKFLLVLASCFAASTSNAQEETICAVVKIEIKQELTLERQAFDAEMIIHNGFDDISLEDVSVDVYFQNEDSEDFIASSDPNSTSASFYMRLSNTKGISGTFDDELNNGSIAPSATATANWLIIPTPGSAVDPNGSIYFVGATLTYTVNGEEESVFVVPDRIVVKPLPLLTLDYFLQQEVISDDAFTPEIEPAQPFTLGVRIKNNGVATANDVAIESAQPTIVENEQGLAIGFEIINSFIADQPVNPGLLLDFGDVPSEESVMGRWQMVTNLSGEFTDFSASFTHADELGGELTSILEATNTHLLIKDVLVDANGRDTILDFLADDGGVIRVYESNSVDTTVSDRSSSAVVTSAGGEQYSFTFPAAASNEFVFAKVEENFGFNGNKEVISVLRSDGKRLPLSNVWFSQIRNTDDASQFDHFINLFDVGSTGSYRITVADKVFAAAPPVLQFIPDRTVVEGNLISFLVEASDPNGTIPAIAAEGLPAGAVLALDNTDNNVATYTFSWTPTTGEDSQAGRYEINFIASDGALESNRRMFIDVLSNNDSDNDGLDDQWEIDNFGNLDRDGTGDYDGDGISDLDEYLLGSDPLTGPTNGPSEPVIESPLYAAKVDTLNPVLTIQNSETQNASAAVVYEFEVYSDASMTQLVDSRTVEESVVETTAYAVSASLIENTRYYWRVRAFDGVIYSQWVTSEFFVDSVAEAPGLFSISAPSDGSDVTSLQPTLEVSNSTDPDEDTVTYVFSVYADQSLSVLVQASEDIAAGTEGSTQWQVTTALQDNTEYFWVVTASDDDALSTSTNVSTFFVNTQNDPPTGLTIISPADTTEVTTANVDLVVSEATDPDDSSLFYEFEVDTVNTFDSGDLLQSGESAATIYSLNSLIEDATYYWRVRASDGFVQTAWLQASFTVNAENEAPPVPTIDNPGDGSWVPTLLPTLSANPVVDPDGDNIQYRFEVYLDEAMTNLVASNESDLPTWVLTEELVDNVWYFWRVQSVDSYDLNSEWSGLSRFFVDDSNTDDPSSYDQTVEGTNTDDTVDGAAGSDDYLNASEGNDTVNGNSGDDYIIGGAGDDVLSGDQGNDIYEINLGEGVDVINNYDADTAQGLTTDIVRFGAGINVEDVVVTRDGNNLVFTIGSEGQSVTVNDYFSVDTDGGLNNQISYVQFENGTVWDQSALSDLVYSSLATDGDDEINGYDDSDDVIYARDGNDTVRGYAGNDQLYGDAGDDTLEGWDGDDVLVGGTGNDTLNGNNGSDTYIIELGHGQDVIVNHDYGTADGNTQDVLRFGEGIAPADIRIDWQLYNNNITLEIGGTEQTVLLTNYLRETSDNYFPYAITRIEFFDGTVWQHEDIVDLVLTSQTTDGDDVIDGFLNSDDVLYGGDGNDTVRGQSGNDQVYGEAGDDRVEGWDGDDTIIGGTGNDTLYGNAGSDTYIINLGDGHDTISNNDADTANGITQDVLRFGEGISPSDIGIGWQLYSNNLTLYVGDEESQSVLIKSYFYEPSEGYFPYRLTAIEFTDGTVWQYQDVVDLVISSQITEGDDVIDGFNRYGDVIYAAAGNDLVRGRDGNDQLYGEEGDDRVEGWEGDDIIVGGVGNDTLYGNAGSDTYIINLGDGQDTISNLDEDTGNGITQDILRFGEGIAPSDISIEWELYNDGITLVVGNTSQTVLIQSYFNEPSENYFPNALTAIEFADGTVWQRQDVIERVITSQVTDGDDVIDGFNRYGDEIYAGAGADTVRGQGGDDQLYGEAGNDTLEGWDGDDVLVGGPGNDALNGNAGSDVYLIELGDGQDVITNTDPDTTAGLTQDILRFGAGILPGDVSAAEFEGSLVFTVVDDTQTVTIDGYFYRTAEGEYPNQITAVEFEDGTVWQHDDIMAVVYAYTDGNDEIFGLNSTDDSISGGLGDDTLWGANLNDTLNGNDGNDTLYGGNDDDTLMGGKGDDFLKGDEGNDTYVIELDDGHDQIDNYDVATAEGTTKDTLTFGDGIDKNSVTLTQDGTNLVIDISSTQSVTLIRYFQVGENGLYNNEMSEIVFNNGDVWIRTDIEAILAGSP